MEWDAHWNTNESYYVKFPALFSKLRCDQVVAWQFSYKSQQHTWNIFTIDFSQLVFHFTVKFSVNYLVKSAVRISQLISQNSIRGIHCEIQGASMLSFCFPQDPAGKITLRYKLTWTAALLPEVVGWGSWHSSDPRLLRVSCQCECIHNRFLLIFRWWPLTTKKKRKKRESVYVFWADLGNALKASPSFFLSQLHQEDGITHVPCAQWATWERKRRSPRPRSPQERLGTKVVMVL